MPPLDVSSVRAQIVQDLGLEVLPEEAQDRIIARIGENVMAAVTLAILTKLPAEVQDEFKSLAQGGDAKKVDELVRRHIPDLDAFVSAEAQKEIAAFKEAYRKQLAQA